MKGPIAALLLSRSLPCSARQADRLSDTRPAKSHMMASAPRVGLSLPTTAWMDCDRRTQNANDAQVESGEYGPNAAIAGSVGDVCSDKCHQRAGGYKRHPDNSIGPTLAFREPDDSAGKVQRKISSLLPVDLQGDRPRGVEEAPVFLNFARRDKVGVISQAQLNVTECRYCRVCILSLQMPRNHYEPRAYHTKRVSRKSAGFATLLRSV
jgi:hypothetical protein